PVIVDHKYSLLSSIGSNCSLRANILGFAGFDCGKRNLENEPRTLAFAIALRPDSAAVSLNELARKCEPQPGALLLSGVGVIQLDKLPEHSLEILAFDSDTTIGDSHAQLPSRPRSLDAYAAAVRRVFDGVAHKVVH